jgi:hypothetical protein
MKILRCLAPVLAGCFSVSVASSATFDDVQFWVGSGANRAALVIDWNDGKSAESLVWGYRWDGSATGLDMFHAIVSADPRLFANVSPLTQFGTSVYGIGYDLNGNHVFNVSPGLSFDAGGWIVGSPDDSRAPSEAADHWSEGWNFGFWGYDVKSSSGGAWGFADSGPDGRVLSDGVWDGYSFAPGFNFTDPSDPLAAPVPEPTTAVLGLAGGIALLVRRFRTPRAGNASIGQ